MFVCVALIAQATPQQCAPHSYAMQYHHYHNNNNINNNSNSNNNQRAHVRAAVRLHQPRAVIDAQPLEDVDARDAVGAAQQRAHRDLALGIFGAVARHRVARRQVLHHELVQQTQHGALVPLAYIID